MGHPNLPKSRAKISAAEFPNLVKGLATRAAAEYPGTGQGRHYSSCQHHGA